MSQKRKQKGFKIEPKTKIQRTSKEPRPPSGTEDQTENVTTAIENNTDQQNPPTTLIADLKLYKTNWIVQGVVTTKTDVRGFQSGKGRFFNFTIADESGKKIQITAFNTDADSFFPLVEQDKTYRISNGTLKKSNANYASVNEYEIILTRNSNVVLCVSSTKINTFVPISEIEKKDANSLIDVIGICKSVEPVSEKTTKEGVKICKRDFQLMDDSGKEITFTLWEDKARKFDGTSQAIVAVRSAKVSDFGGRSLILSYNSTIMVNPDITEATRLKEWYKKQGKVFTESLTNSPNVVINWKSLSEMKNAPEEEGEWEKYYEVTAKVADIEQDIYEACTTDRCNRKLRDLEKGSYYCPKCEKTSPNVKYRLRLKVKIEESGDVQWVTCFHETAEVLLGHNMTQESLKNFKENDKIAFEDILNKVISTSHVFIIKVKVSSYQNEKQMNHTVLKINCCSGTQG